MQFVEFVNNLNPYLQAFLVACAISSVIILLVAPRILKTKPVTETSAEAPVEATVSEKVNILQPTSEASELVTNTAVKTEDVAIKIELINPSVEELKEYSKKHNTNPLPFYKDLADGRRVLCYARIEDKKFPLIVSVQGIPCNTGWRNSSNKLVKVLNRNEATVNN